jgi:hypothetical protein
MLNQQVGNRRCYLTETASDPKGLLPAVSCAFAGAWVCRMSAGLAAPNLSRGHSLCSILWMG